MDSATRYALRAIVQQLTAAGTFDVNDLATIMDKLESGSTALVDAGEHQPAQELMLFVSDLERDAEEIEKD